MNILITGGAGYIGTHIIIELINNNHTVVVVDNFSNSNQESLTRVEKITHSTIPTYHYDVRDVNGLDNIFMNHEIDAVIHLAGLKAVGDSVTQPLEYYNTNITSTLSLLSVMVKHGVRKIIFSSTATVYGDPENLPLTELSRAGIGITSPYARTKFMIEQILNDLSLADNTLEVTILRYFNPIGAHESGEIGENPNGIPNNLLPYISQVAIGVRDAVNVYGDDYETADGTGVRDYIHVVDLARGHVAALNHIKPGAEIYNLCTGYGTSVLELIAAFNKASARNIPYRITSRRPGDIASYYASPQKAKKRLGWAAEKTIQDACVDTWRWQLKNPDGYNK